MTLFRDNAGPLLQYQNGVLFISDLNPEMKTRWRMSCGEMVRLGWRCILASLKR
jgi:hypothetical protein